MKDEIIHHLDKPRQLEELYRSNKTSFKDAFNALYPEIEGNHVSKTWYERLNYSKLETTKGAVRELTFFIVASFVAGILATLPNLTTIDSAHYYLRNISFIVFPLLIIYFTWKHQLEPKKWITTSVGLLISLIYINLLPGSDESDTLLLACIHLPLLLWATLGFTFAEGRLKSCSKRIDFLRYNGDLIVITTIILIAGILLTAITISLFSLINVSVDQFYLQYIVPWGLAAAPIIGTYFVQTNPQLVNRVSPVIARVFTPLVLITLVVYLAAMIGADKDPYQDRDFLLVFNILLIGVMAIILFSVAETSQYSRNKIAKWLLLSLSVVTIIINGIALSAILFRLLSWGITPNRLAVLGGNVLILTHLLMVTYRLSQTIGNNRNIGRVKQSIVVFLPVYSIWTVLIIFLFPVIFGFN